MKNLLIALFCLAGFTASAQLGQGNILLGGCVGFMSETTESQPDDIKNSTVVIEPHVFYNFTSNWAAGLSVGYEIEKEETPSGTFFNEIKTSGFTVSPSVKWYHNWEERFSCSAKLALGIGSGEIENTSTFTDPFTNVVTTQSVTDKYSLFSVGIYPGINYHIGRKVMIGANYGALQYESVTQKPDSSIPNAEDITTSSIKAKLDAKKLRFNAYYVFGGNTLAR